MKQRRILLIGTLIAVLLVAMSALASLHLTGDNGRGKGPLPPEKQAILDAEQQERQAALARPHAPKRPLNVPKSCPEQIKPGIAPMFAGAPTYLRHTLNIASVLCREA
jgi:hypothetical protein